LSLAPRYLVCSLGLCPAPRFAGSRKLSASARALDQPVPLLFRRLGQGDTWLSQVPAFPQCCHAPLSDPGGVPTTCQTVGGTAAFRSFHRVGFGCPAYAEQLSCCPQLYSFRGSITRPDVLLPPAPYSPHGGCTRSSLLPCWLGFREVGLAPLSAHPLGNDDLFHGLFLHSLGLGLCLARGTHHIIADVSVATSVHYTALARFG
jgi:hypothetical protein